MDKMERMLLVKAIREQSFEEKAGMRGSRGKRPSYGGIEQRLSPNNPGKLPGQQEPTPKGYISPQEKKRRGTVRYKLSQRIKNILR